MMAPEATVIKIRLVDLCPTPRAVWPESYMSAAAGQEFAIFRTGDRYITVDRYCPHKKADLARFGYPKEGDGVLLCTAHAHEYRLDTGKCLLADTCRLMLAYVTRVNTDDETIEITRTSEVLENPS